MRLASAMDEVRQHIQILRDLDELESDLKARYKAARAQLDPSSMDLLIRRVNELDARSDSPAITRRISLIIGEVFDSQTRAALVGRGLRLGSAPS